MLAHSIYEPQIYNKFIDELPLKNLHWHAAWQEDDLDLPGAFQRLYAFPASRGQSEAGGAEEVYQAGRRGRLGGEKMDFIIYPIVFSKEQ